MKKFFVGLFYVISLAIFCFIVLMVIVSFSKPTPKGNERRAIEICIENVEKDTKYDRTYYAFLMKSCDNKAEEFQRKYGHKP